jgi:ABC-type iron transport system FetAB ATPase subunit
VTILNNINFQLRAGEFKLITGPSGCGKSTLLKIIASLLSPTSGRLFSPKDIATLSPETYRQQVSYCAQTPALFGDSVYDNLVFPWQIRINSRIRRRWWPICSALVWRKIRWKNQSMNFPAGKSSAFR